jgi:hypothetical protein
MQQQQEHVTPLIFFVHVPKTAGSTVNTVLSHHSQNGRGHIEAIVDDDKRFMQVVDSVDWMSGHVNRDRIEARIRRFTTRPIRFFACVRHPTAHLASHYNWLLIQGEQFDENTHLNNIYSAIKNNGFTPDGVIRTLSRFPDLLNFQTSFLLGRDFGGGDADFREALARRFELITVDPDEAVSAMLDKRIITMQKENVATYAFDSAIFYDDKVLDFLAEKNRKDEMVYRIVASFGGGSASSRLRLEPGVDQKVF